MKKKIALSFCLAILLLIALAFSCCSLFQNGVEFINNSSYTVSVYPLDTSWNYFELAPGEKHTVTTDQGYVSFMYSPTSSVRCDKSPGKVVFSNY
ncbi:MAG: hypothetical protein ABSG38_18440 [Spirochaetia bacterium]|jgi:hypothetical protein